MIVNVKKTPLVAIAFFLLSTTAHPVLAEPAPSLSDPTLPNWFGITKVKKRPPSLVLNSLVNGSQRRIAVISGKLMREGESKGGFTLKKILDDRVLIRTKAGKTVALKLKNPANPKTSNNGRAQ